MAIPRRIIAYKLHEFLMEDLGQGDITTAATVPSGRKVEAFIIAKEDGVLAGLEEVEILLESLGLEVKPLVADGSSIRRGDSLIKISGEASSILMAERTALNILMRMSGIATETQRLILKVRSSGFNVKIACTRKTAPGLRYFDKKAVMLGGGETHRIHLDDMVLIKDNHIAVAGGLEKAIMAAKAKVSFSKKIEVEVSNIEDAVKAARLGVDVIMLDNMNPKDANDVIDKLRKLSLRDKVLIEVSGGINEENILQYAAVKPDIISVGYITENPKTLDMSLKVRLKK
jgi:nicotinate-nucleotide pyrophosphorylase (carboxylating)